MQKTAKIILTGAAGFIGSYVTGFLARRGYHNLLLVDDFNRPEKAENINLLKAFPKMQRSEFLSSISEVEADLFIHLGARTDTTEFDESIFEELNIQYSEAIWIRATQLEVPLIYASSAATYGGGEHGFSDWEPIEKLRPLNPYGQSKQDFDVWALAQENKPPFFVGLKFFNVYGPNEYHKGRMASVVFHAYNQIKKTGKMKLFRSHHPDFKDGEQARDFIYVQDVAEVIHYWMQQKEGSGLYNLGTGQARTFLDLVRATFKAMNLPEQIEFIDTPKDLRETYQYFTEARMQKTRAHGYSNPFMPLESGVEDYVKNYLLTGSHYA
jgi:ADP-L-glycero-D-manno-heptose 6-epimerase